MATKKLQIVGSLVNQAQDADTLDGKHAEEFAAASDVEELKELVGDTSVSEQIDTALASAKGYADSAANTVKNDLLNGAGEAYDTLKELGDLIDDNQDAISALETVASGKADAEHNHDDAYEALGSVQSALTTANTYTDNAVAQKTQVQFITWEADD